MDKCEAVKVLNLMIEKGQDRNNEAIKMAINVLLDASNLKIERTGKWKKVKRPWSKVEPVQCNICNRKMYWTGRPPKYCPHCGTRMVSE